MSTKKFNLMLKDEIKKININLKNLSMQNKNNEKNDDIIWYVNIIKKWWNRKKNSILKTILGVFFKKKPPLNLWIRATRVILSNS